MSAFVAGFGPWPAVVVVGLVLVWSVVVVREFTRGQLMVSGRPFTVRLGPLSIEVGAQVDDA